MSKREELINELESKLSQKLKVDKRFQQQNFLSWEPIQANPELYKKNITESSRLDSEVSDLINFIKMLPKENTPEWNKKRDNLISNLESEMVNLRNLQSQMNEALPQPMSGPRVRVLNYQINDLNNEIVAKQKLLSVL